MGVVGKRLFERSEFPVAAHEAEQRRKQAGGCALFFGYLLLSKQKKVTRLEAKRNGEYRKIAIHCNKLPTTWLKRKTGELTLTR
jgi:hypothetical protein